ncbi:hypothetical protein [Sporosalibacterium faouarense]|uniref:hypothetical protein n=1 Tax=Sporosalibacterium faouarense TaxID=516123 RepID=UPI00192B7696|nr:hypothetical protein [Sporosalibacterium faouarense]
MMKTMKRFFIFTIVFFTVVSVGWVIYSSVKSNKEVPKRATLVMNTIGIEQERGKHHR